MKVFTCTSFYCHRYFAHFSFSHQKLSPFAISHPLDSILRCNQICGGTLQNRNNFWFRNILLLKFNQCTCTKLMYAWQCSMNWRRKKTHFIDNETHVSATIKEFCYSISMPWKCVWKISLSTRRSTSKANPVESTWIL